MKIEEGKSYRTSDGRKISNMRWNSEHRCYYGIDERVGCAFTRAYRPNGKHGSDFICNEPLFDLVAEWEPPGPVVTETVKRLVEGQYGLVKLDIHRDQHVVTISPDLGWNAGAADLRTAAATLTAIADALDDTK